ncbi:MAG: hypothetical protein HZA16_04600 [Nitrospirae bacterium]|nr:hypothetical protein [Nitrospirota bacterium]
MLIIKNITNFFLSLRTTLWLLGFMLALMLAGAVIMPGQNEFQSIHSVPMLEWLQKQPGNITWWLWGSIGLLSVLAVNTLFCSIESLVKKRKVTQWLLLISPQIIHIGFLFILLAHLLSAAGSYQATAVAAEGDMLRISDDAVLRVKEINIRSDPYGYITDWKVGIEYLKDGRLFLTDMIAPNSPSTQMGFNINVKDLRAYPEAVLLQISREPGAVWALAGGILFMTGILALIALKMKMER